MAAVLADRGDTALVFRGDDGLDELTTTTTSSVWVADGGAVTRGDARPGRVRHRRRWPPEALRGGDPAFNAAVVRDVLAGGGGGVRDVVLLNAAAAIAAYDGLTARRPRRRAARAACDVAADAVDTGAAAALLDALGRREPAPRPRRHDRRDRGGYWTVTLRPVPHAPRAAARPSLAWALAVAIAGRARRSRSRTTWPRRRGRAHAHGRDA